jgi:uncharacterized protein YdgA (DUF945 family)
VKRIAVSLAAVALLAAPTGTAYAATPSPTAQIKALQKQVTTLQKQVKLLTNALEANFAYDECQTAVTADTFQWTWALADKLTNFPPFPPTSTTPQVDDKQSCNGIVTRPTVTGEAAPTQAIFQTLINWIG